MKYRKKPVVVEVRQLQPGAAGQVEIIKWLRDNGVQSHADVNGVVIPTLEGDHLALFGDYVIQGVQGEFYPCKPDIFKATYEAVE